MIFHPRRTKASTGDELEEYLYETFDLELSPDEAKKFRDYQNMTNLLNGILSVEA